MQINSKKSLNSNISYAGGLTKPMITDIRNTDVSKIQNYLAKNNINSDFQNNKLLRRTAISGAGLEGNTIPIHINRCHCPIIHNPPRFCYLPLYDAWQSV